MVVMLEVTADEVVELKVDETAAPWSWMVVVNGVPQVRCRSQAAAVRAGRSWGGVLVEDEPDGIGATVLDSAAVPWRKLDDDTWTCLTWDHLPGVSWAELIKEYGPLRLLELGA